MGSLISDKLARQAEHPRRDSISFSAGTPPPEVVGREAWIEHATFAVDRVRPQRTTSSIILPGLTDVGKTGLLGEIRLDAKARRWSGGDRIRREELAPDLHVPGCVLD